jgi:DNA-binding protein H-NS
MILKFFESNQEKTTMATLNKREVFGYFKGLTYAELKEMRVNIDGLLSGKEQENKDQAMTKVQKILLEHGMDLDTMLGKAPQRRAAAKYKNPATTQTWSGRGRKPKWVDDAISKGRKLEDLAIAQPVKTKSEQPLDEPTQGAAA